MWKLILIITLGGEAFNQGSAVSQHEYVFDTQKQCEAVAAFYNQHDVKSYLQPNHALRTKVIARCWAK